MRKIIFFDTTLRDGEQMTGLHLTAAQRLDIAKQLQRLGADVIEAGFPTASKGEYASVEAIASELHDSVVCALARAKREDILRTVQAISNAPKRRLHTFIATSDLHIEYKLRSTRADVLARVGDSVAYARELCDDVEFSAEDATRSDRDFLCEVFRTAIGAGATVINIPDTVGYAAPEEFVALIEYIRSRVDTSGVTLSVHCHNDLGLAVANSLAALGAGVTQLECTVNGLGERAGNAPLEELALALDTRRDHFGAEHGLNLTEITRTSRLVSSLSGVVIPPNKAIVGANAFSHASGIHQHGVLCNRSTYEIISPERIGLRAGGLTLGRLSGRHAFEERIRELGFTLDDGGIAASFEIFKQNADRKPSVTDEDIMAIVNEYLDSKTAVYKLDSFQIQSGNRVKAMAMITLCRIVDDSLHSEAALGDGPIDAAFNAVDRILGAVDTVKLESYNIKAITEGTDALGEVLVKIRADGAVYTGRGVSSDIIKASIKAYINAVNKMELNRAAVK